MAQKLSRPQRWAKAVSEAQDALSKLQAALSELNDMRSDYESWKDNLPESLADSTIGEKLEEICNLEFDGVADDIEELLNNAESVDLPRGFGRD